jgi:hypothetical protein
VGTVATSPEGRAVGIAVNISTITNTARMPVRNLEPFVIA